MYKKQTFKYMRPCAVYTDRELVTEDFMMDAAMGAPASVRVYKTRIVVYFPGGKYSCRYTMPVRFLKYVNGGNEQ